MSPESKKPYILIIEDDKDMVEVTKLTLLSMENRGLMPSKKKNLI